jgi:predicted nuclease of predicted toxin-antitoxin system
MKLLLDECLAVEFRHDILGHDVYTVVFMGWKGVKNGQLLALAAANGFEALITIDRGIENQQNLATLPLAVVILHSGNRMAELRAIAPHLLRARQTLAPKAVTHVHP